MSHPHRHGAIDLPSLNTQRGLSAIKWSFVGLVATTLIQAVVVWLSGSAALFADTVHNFGDAATAIPLWVAFTLARLKPTKRFTYGYGRAEDLAGLMVVVAILLSAIMAVFTSVNRIVHPQPVAHLWAVMGASVVGFIGNEAVAHLRITVGKEIGSMALVADGYHARVDGLTSLVVLVGAMGAMFGYPLADPIAGGLISLVIVHVAWKCGKGVLARLLDRVDAEVVDAIAHAAHHAEGVYEVAELRVRWAGHRLHAEVNITVKSDLSVEKAHQIANEVRHQLLHHVAYLSNVTIHTDPVSASGERHHRIAEHRHGDLPGHSH